MKYIKSFIVLNTKKILSKFILYYFLWILLALFFYYYHKNYGQVQGQENKLILLFFWGCTTVFYILSFIKGVYHFYKSRNYFAYIVNEEIFDNYHIGSMYKNDMFFYTIECMYGSISGIQSIIYIQKQIGKYDRTEIVAIFKISDKKYKYISIPVPSMKSLEQAIDRLINIEVQNIKQGIGNKDAVSQEIKIQFLRTSL